MSAPTTAATPADPVATPRVPLGRLIEVELRKMVDTRAGMWLFIAIGLVTAAAVVLYMFFAPPEDLTLQGFAGVSLVPQGFLLPVLGILLITSEWGQRTALVTFTLEPSRPRVVLAKTVAALVVGVLAVAVLLVVALAGTWLGTLLQDGDGSTALGLRGLGSVLILQVSAILQGLAFGMILMNSAAAIVAYFVLPIAFNLLFTLVSALQDIGGWVDISTAQMPLFTFDQGLSGEEWAQLAVASSIWILLPFALGMLRLVRSEVKSA